ncbi:hypothetical protein QL285_075259 [Trifolium repens]|nr:hypothetical protein QL285_075259 [Trifolium repens]
MERQVTKDASGSKEESKKEAEPWQCEENRLRYERNKQELRLTESEREELGSDLEEFLWTYDDDTSYEDYRAEVQKATEELLAVLRKKYKDWMQRLLSLSLNLSRVSLSYVIKILFNYNNKNCSCYKFLSF